MSLLEAYDPAAVELEDSPIRVAWDPDELPTAISPDSIEGYLIQNEIHRGGQGIVYKATQLSTKREVALKFMLSGPFASQANRRRFQREVELASSLFHPGIVPVFDSGLCHGHYYYVMEYIPGECLNHYAAENKLTSDEILKLFISICDAINYAHQNGVIHRDLKPSNIIVSEQGQPHVLDFGLAKLGGQDLDDTLPLSRTGQIMGTLAYMSPEQAAGDHQQCDIRSDVYSLGVILYELLAGHLPYDLNNALSENLLTIQHAEPKPLVVAGQRVPRDLTTIVMKALSKEKDRRYQTAGSLSDDLSRFLNGDPIEARRNSALYVLRKTLARHIVPAAVGLLFVVLAVIASVISSILYFDARNAREAERIAANKYRKERDLADQRAKMLRQTLYFSEMNRAGQHMHQPGGVGQVREILANWQPRMGEADPRGWEWACLSTFCQRERFVLDGHTATIWCVQWSPDGSRVASSATDDGSIRIWDAASGRQIESINTVSGRWIDWSPDGSLLASSSFGGPVFIWNVETGREVCRLDGHARGTSVVCTQWNPEGTRLASCSTAGELIIWDPINGRKLRHINVGLRVQSLCWSPASDQIVVGGTGSCQIFDPETGASIWKSGHIPGGVDSVAWSPDGNRIALGLVKPQIRIVDAQSHAELKIMKIGTPGNVRSVSWNPSSTELISAHDDRTLRHWDAKSGRLIQVLSGHAAQVLCARWSPDGTQVVSAGMDYSVRLWDVRPPDQSRNFDGVKYFTTSIDWNSASSRLVFSGNDRLVRVWNPATGEIEQTIDARSELEGGLGDINSVRISPDGSQIATAGQDHTIRIFELGTGKQRLVLRGNEKRALSVSWHPDGTKLAGGGVDGNVRIWDTDSGKLITQIVANDYVHALAWSPDGKSLAFTSFTNGTSTATIQFGPSLTKKTTLTGHESRVYSICWRHDGKQLATGSKDGSVRIWDTMTGTTVSAPMKHGGAITSLDWLSDVENPRIFAATNAATIVISDPISASRVLTLQVPTLNVNSISLSPDHKRLAAAYHNRLTIWDATRSYPPTSKRNNSSK